MKEKQDNQPTLTPPNEWVSVEERLPEHLKDVIALYGNGRIDIDWVDSFGDFKFGSFFDGVTHWMPLPAPPDRRPPEGNCEIKDYAETCDEWGFCGNTPTTPPEGGV